MSINNHDLSLQIKILFIGTADIYEDVKKNIPKIWKIYHVNSLEEFKNQRTSVNVILDASIRDAIDLKRKEFSNVKFVCCASTGSNHIITPPEKSGQISIITLRDVPDVLSKLTSAAEFSFGLLIALARNLIPAALSVSSGTWNRTDYPGMILSGKELGIIGYGRIGKSMAVYAKSFGMKVSYYDPHVKTEQRGVIVRKTLEDLVSKSDFITLHVPYDSASSLNPLLTKKNFLKFKPGSYFINTSRGELIDERGLISAFEAGIIKGAALDVLCNEPDVENNLIFKYFRKSGANILFTPHIGGYSLENVRIATLGILDFLKFKLRNNDNE